MYVHCTYVRRRITRSGNSAALLLSQDLLGLMRVQPGDEVEVELVDRTLIVRPLNELRRGEAVRDAVDAVFARFAPALRRLATDDHDGLPPLRLGELRKKPAARRVASKRAPGKPASRARVAAKKVAKRS
jgi:antitoxin component of MazEF toxin-antitoxin module